MRILEFNTVIGLGDLILSKAQLDNIKHNYDEIRLTFDPHTFKFYRDDNPEYQIFLNEIGELFFSEHPYKLNIGQFRVMWPSNLWKELGIPMVIPRLKNLLCKGNLINLNEEYIVITTKVRYLSRKYYNQNVYPRFWGIINQLSKKYKVVVMGERNVEMGIEYQENGSDIVYSIYDDIMRNIPNDRILDLTIPALGITAPNLAKIQQDCLIMSEAKFVVSFGIGGNLQLSIATSNAINHRFGRYEEADMLYGEHTEFESSISTKILDHFLNRLKMYY